MSSNNLPTKERGLVAHYPEDSLLELISELLYANWRELAICLKVNISQFDEPNYNIYMTHDMFMLWWNSKRNDGKWDDLKSALKEICRIDLIEYTTAFFKKHNSIPFKGSDYITQNYFISMAKRMVKQWYELGLYLDIGVDELENIKCSYSPRKHNRSLEILKIWKAKETSPPCELIKYVFYDQKLNVLKEMIDSM